MSILKSKQIRALILPIFSAEKFFCDIKVCSMKFIVWHKLKKVKFLNGPIQFSKYDEFEKTLRIYYFKMLYRIA